MSIEEVDFNEVKEVVSLYFKIGSKARTKKLWSQPKFTRDVYDIMNRQSKDASVVSEILKISEEECEKILDWLFREGFTVLSHDGYRLR